MTNAEAQELRVHAQHLRERARGVMDNEHRRRLYQEAADLDQLADDIEADEKARARDDGSIER